MSWINFSISDIVPVGSLVNARFKGNFHDAIILDVETKLKCKIGYMKNNDYLLVSLDSRLIKGDIKIDHDVRCEIDGQDTVATIKSIIDVSTYKLDFFDGDYGYAKRRQLLVKKLPESYKNDNSDIEPTKITESTNNSLNSSRDDSALLKPGKRNTFNSLLSSLDSMDPNESSMIMNAIEMSLNESKGRSRSQSSSKSSITSHKYNNNTPKEYEKIKNSSSSTDLSNNDVSSSLSSSSSSSRPSKNIDEEPLDELVYRKLSKSVLLTKYDHINMDDLLEIFHIELYSKVNGVPIIKYPSIKGEAIDIYQMMELVNKLGGSETVSENKQWREIAIDLHLQNIVPATFCCLKRFFNRWLQPYTTTHHTHSRDTLPKKCCTYISKINQYFITKLDPTNKTIDLTKYKLNNSDDDDDDDDDVDDDDIDRDNHQSISNRSNINKIENNLIDTTKLLTTKHGSNKTNSHYGYLNIKKESNLLSLSKRHKNKRADALISSNEATDKSIEDVDFGKDHPHHHHLFSIMDNDDDNYYLESQFYDTNSYNPKKDDNNIYDSIEEGEYSLRVGSFIMVRYGKLSSSHDYYPAKIISIRRFNNIYTYLVHYKGWNSRYDEWIHSKRILFDKKISTTTTTTSTTPQSDNNHETLSNLYKNSNKIINNLHNDQDEPPTLSSPHNVNNKNGGSNGAVIQKRPKGRPPTKPQSIKSKLLPKDSQKSLMAIKNSNDETLLTSSSTTNATTTTTIISSKDVTSNRVTTTKVSTIDTTISTKSINKNKHNNKSKPLLISNFGGGRHRRTRNSLEDAILNAVIEQSVLESQNISESNDTQKNDTYTDKDHLLSSSPSSPHKTDTNTIDEIMASIIGGNSNKYNELELVYRNKVDSNQPTTSHSNNSSKLGGANNTTSRVLSKNRGGKRTKSTQSIKNSPSYTNLIPMNESINSSENDEIATITTTKNNPKERSSPITTTTNTWNKSTNSHMNNYITHNNGNDNSNSLYSTKKRSTNKTTKNIVNNPKILHNNDNNNKKRSTDYDNDNHTVNNNTNEIQSKESTTHDKKLSTTTTGTTTTTGINGKPSKYYNQSNNTNKHTIHNNIDELINSQSDYDYYDNKKNYSNSTISFISKINDLTDYFIKKYKSIDGELTSKASLDNVRKLETFLSEIQQSHIKVKQKLRKLERKRKIYLQKN